MKYRIILSALLIAFFAAACGDGESKSVAPAEEEPVAIHPLTGVELPDGRPENAVFVVKVDNTNPAAPQIGLDQADIVVEQLVDGLQAKLYADRGYISQDLKNKLKEQDVVYWYPIIELVLI